MPIPQEEFMTISVTQIKKKTVKQKTLDAEIIAVTVEPISFVKKKHML